MRGVLEALPVGVWLMTREGSIVLGNPAGRSIWAGARYVGPEQFGEYKGWWASTGKPIAADEWAAARAISRGESSIDEEIRIRCFDGSFKTILNSAIPLRDAQQQIVGAIIVNQDITSRVKADEELRQAKQAADSANVELQRALERAQRRCVCPLRRRGVCRSVAGNRHRRGHAGCRAHKVERARARCRDADPQRFRLSVSAGVAAMQTTDRDLGGFLQRADQALYDAKAAGRNCVRVSRP